MPLDNCPEVFTHGDCNIPDCPLNHDLPKCEHCSLLFITEDDYQTHLSTNEHLSRTTRSSNVSYCSVCQKNVAGGQTEWMNHVRAHNHSNQAYGLGASPNVQPQFEASTNHASFCEVCEMVVEAVFWKVHLGSAKHLSRVTFFRYKATMQEAEADKHGIGIDGVFEFDCIAPQAAKRGVNNLITIRAKRPHVRCILFNFKLCSSNRTSSTNSG